MSRIRWVLFSMFVLGLGALPACSGAAAGRGRQTLTLDERRAVDACFREADQALREGDLERAEGAYTKALGIHPDLAEAYFERGTLRLERLKQDADVRRGEEAIKDFSAALRLVPGYAKALFNRAVAYYQLADRWPALYKDAARDLKKMLESGPHDAEAHYFLARILDERMEGMEAEAASHYQKHVELGGRRPDAPQRLLALAPRLQDKPPAPAESRPPAAENRP